jgi:cell wall-associated NlpC family hydrolase
MNGQKVRTHGLLPGDILLFRGESIISKMICWIDSSDVSHAGLYLGNNQVAEALIVGNPGLNVNDLSLDGSEWVTARRLNESQAFEPIGKIANSYLGNGPR